MLLNEECTPVFVCYNPGIHYGSTSTLGSSVDENENNNDQTRDQSHKCQLTNSVQNYHDLSKNIHLLFTKR